MLSELNVKNLALIEQLSITFGPGANIMTGETGTGKSILVGALGLLMGRRAGADLLRAGADEARVSALFSLEDAAPFAPILEDMGLQAADEIILSRVISASGKSRAHINGAPATQGQLAALGEALLNISGQHEQQALLKPAQQLDYLDRFGGHHNLLADMRAAWHSAQKSAEELRELEEGLAETEEKRDLYEFQLAEIEKIKPRPHEDEELLEEKNRAKSSLKFIECLEGATAALSAGPGNALEKLGQVKRHLEQGAALDERLVAPLSVTTDSYHQLADLMVTLNRLGRDGEADPGRLEWVDERLNALAKLRRKYGPALDEVIERGRFLRETLGALDGAGLDLARLRRLRDEAISAALSAAKKLHAARQKAGDMLAARLTESLRPLGFPKIEMRVAAEAPESGREADHLTPKGFSVVNFLFCPNPGEGLKPLAKIASGGELSRVMLALKTVEDRPGGQLLVFDEIDSGLGGITAEAVTAKIASLARYQQLIVITHLPQMAALPGKHFVVAKEADPKGRTSTSIAALAPAQRLPEISRMLGGASPSPEAVALAGQLLGHYAA